ncbi:MAG: NADH-ubiquinone oxidoreductase-F iron-sulfur binding region domain-containing protein, partial [Clostridiaceae bacterium]
MVCRGTGCTSSHSDKLQHRLEELVEENGLQDKVNVSRTGCFGLCQAGPIMVVFPEETFYPFVKPEDLDRIFKEDIVGGKPVYDLHIKKANEASVSPLSEVSFYAKQKRIALRHSGIIDPEKIEEYIALGGYEALYKALHEMSPKDVIQEIKDSGLRGRGGGGFPSGLKWEFTAREIGPEKFVVCNADEGDPGAFMDRSILEGDPHSVMEAMAIAGYAIGADHGYIYIRAEYPIAVQRLEIALKQAKELGVLGNNIFGTDFSFDLEIRLGAGAFVCGEETALIASIEGERGMPRNKPPFPANKGLWQKPTLINNVETFANVAAIISNGAAWFKGMGTEKSAGTKVFALGGKINNVGLVEVPMGTTLREVVYDIGGGIPNGKKFKAVQTGGPSGGCITEANLDTPIDFDNLVSIGSMMGSGGMIVMDSDNCMVDVARFYMDFIAEESCGKCTPCREGTKRMLEILELITEGKATREDLKVLEELANTVKIASLCGLGQTAPNP